MPVQVKRSTQKCTFSVAAFEISPSFIGCDDRSLQADAMGFGLLSVSFISGLEEIFTIETAEGLEQTFAKLEFSDVVTKRMRGLVSAGTFLHSFPDIILLVAPIYAVERLESECFRQVE